MALFSEAEASVARAVSGLVYGNPFVPERMAYERAVLGSDFVAAYPVWHAPASRSQNPNLPALHARVEQLADDVLKRLLYGPDRARAEAADLALYEDLVLYLVFYRYFDDFYVPIGDPAARGRRLEWFERFLADLEHYLAVPRGPSDWLAAAPHLFAIFFQVRRAFHFIYRNIAGVSMPAARLRAAVWQSVFTRDVKRYSRVFYDRMGDITTLVTGPSGTGKELVASAIGLSRYLPFDARTRRFEEDFAEGFYALNLSALSPTLIESELFGHRRGAFTGAQHDRAGWLEVCPPRGTVFLDEIGEVDLAIQVKLLRVIQTRTFQRLGDSRDRSFRGKVVAATNRDLTRDMKAGRFREDLYYRLCADQVTTPSLRERLRDSPDELGILLRFVAERVSGADEAETLAAEVARWIDAHVPADYAWPGNVRELEQCVRNIMIRGEYQPSADSRGVPRERLAEEFLDGSCTADELLRRYCTLVYEQTDSYQETARRLELDRRTVRDKIDDALLRELRGEKSARDDP
ncbi:MAG TPA: sigma 54-interacting transcriptional regulator [Methylomirabilota bacterium]|jgi:transcriptional regulator with AAA-type ATPase domain|nr:sigma 54-interacting transcriptional regulator [Methylomirabilota bacterium]